MVEIELRNEAVFAPTLAAVTSCWLAKPTVDSGDSPSVRNETGVLTPLTTTAASRAAKFEGLTYVPRVPFSPVRLFPFRLPKT